MLLMNSARKIPLQVALAFAHATLFSAAGGLSACLPMQTVERRYAHNDDVNAVAYVDDSCQVVASGSDDKLIKVGLAVRELCCLIAALPASLLLWSSPGTHCLAGLR